MGRMSAELSKPISPRAATPRYQPLVVVLAASSVGVVCDRFWPLPLGAWWTVAIAGLCLWLLAWRARRLPVAAVLLLLAVVATAGAWHHCRWNLFAADDLGRFARRKAEPVCVEAVALGTPRRVPPPAPDPMQMMRPGDCSRFEVDLVALRNGATWQPVSGRAMLLVQGEPPKIEAGDRLRCFARLSAPPEPQNPGEFDRAAYLRADRVRSRLQAEAASAFRWSRPDAPGGSVRLLERVRIHGNGLLDHYLAPRQAELAAAVLLGLREELDAGRNEAFLTTGTIHILSISGLHVGILAGALFWIMRRTPVRRGWAVVGIAAVTLLYALMVDVEPPVVRATVLVLVACVSAYFGWHALELQLAGRRRDWSCWR